MLSFGMGSGYGTMAVLAPALFYKCVIARLGARRGGRARARPGVRHAPPIGARARGRSRTDRPTDRHHHRRRRRIFFKGGVLPGTGKTDDSVSDEPDKVHVAMARWFGFGILTSSFGVLKFTSNFTKAIKTALELQAVNWACAAALHVPPMKAGAQPKELCVQQLVAMPLTMALCLAAAQEV